MSGNDPTTRELASSSPSNGEPNTAASVPQTLLSGEPIDEGTTIPDERHSPNYGMEQGRDPNSQTESAQEPDQAQKRPTAQETSNSDVNSTPNENVYHLEISLPSNEEIPLLESVTIDGALSSPKRSKKWLDWILISLWLLSNVALCIATYILARNMDWNGASLITAAPILNHPDGVFRYLNIPLSLTQAKSIDFTVSAVIGPMLIAMANLVWFKLGRSLSLLEEALASTTTTTNPETEKFDSGSYDLSRLSRLIKSSSPRNLLFALLLLSSALSATLLCNTLAYKAIPGSTSGAAANVEDELHYQMVYIPGLLFLAVCNISVASSAALALVFNARRSNAAQEKQQAADLANIFGAPDSLNTVAGVEATNSRGYFKISLPTIPVFFPLNWHLHRRDNNAHIAGFGELEPLLPVSERVVFTPRKASDSNWRFFKIRHTSTGRKLPSANDQGSEGNEESEPRSPASESWQWYRLPQTFRFWNFSPPSNPGMTNDMQPMAKASSAEGDSSDEIERLIVAESSRVARMPAELGRVAGTSEMSRVERNNESAPRTVWTYRDWFGSFRNPGMFKSRRISHLTSEIQIPRNSGAITRISPMRETSQSWSQPHINIPQFILPSPLSPTRDLESQIDAPVPKANNAVERDTQDNIIDSARLMQSFSWGLPRFSIPNLSPRGAATPAQKIVDDQVSNSMESNVEEGRGSVLEAAKREDLDVKQTSQWTDPSTPVGLAGPSNSNVRIQSQGVPTFGQNVEPPKQSSPSPNWTLGGINIPSLSRWSYEGSMKGKGKGKDVSSRDVHRAQPTSGKSNPTRYYSWNLPHVIEYSSSRNAQNHDSSGRKGKQRETSGNIAEDYTQEVQSILATDDIPSKQEQSLTLQPTGQDALTEVLAAPMGQRAETQDSAQNNERNWWNIGWTGPNVNTQPPAGAVSNTEAKKSTERLDTLNYFGHLPSPTTAMRYTSSSSPSHSRTVEASSSSGGFLSTLT